MQNTERNKGPMYLIGLSVCALLLILLNTLPVGNAIKGSFNKIYSPLAFWGTTWGTDLSKSFKLIPNISSLNQENSDLRSKLIELETTLVDYNLLKEKYDSLVKQNKLSTKKFEYIEAEVVKLNNYLVANIGSKNGVKEGSIVVLGNTYIGVVSEVDENSSKIELPISENSSIQILVMKPGEVITTPTDNIKSKANISAVLIGKGEAFELENLLSGAHINIDDLVVSSEVGIGYLIIGKVAEISLDQAASVISLKAEPLYDYSELKYVYIRK